MRIDSEATEREASHLHIPEPRKRMFPGKQLVEFVLITISIMEGKAL